MPNVLVVHTPEPYASAVFLSIAAATAADDDSIGLRVQQLDDAHVPNLSSTHVSFWVLTASNELSKGELCW